MKAFPIGDPLGECLQQVSTLGGVCASLCGGRACSAAASLRRATSQGCCRMDATLSRCSGSATRMDCSRRRHSCETGGLSGMLYSAWQMRRIICVEKPSLRLPRPCTCPARPSWNSLA